MAILIFAVLMFSGTGIDGVFKKADNPFPFDASESLHLHLYQWESQYSLGNANSLNTILLFPMDASIWLLTHIGVPLSIAERIWFVLTFACMGWAFYYLMTVLMSGRQNRVPCLVAALLYMFNPYVLANLSHGQTGILTVLALAPLSLVLFLKGLTGRVWRDRVKFAVLFGLVNSLWVQGDIILTGMAAVLFIFMFAYVLLSHREKLGIRRRLRLDCAYLSLAGLGTVLLSLWWLIPYARTYMSQGEINWSAGLSRDVVETSSSLASLSEIGRLLHGYLPWMSFNTSWVEFWQSWAGALIGFSLMVFVFAALFVYRRNGLVVLFGLLAVGSTIMAMGTKPPFGFFYGFLFEHLPFFDANRRPGNFQFVQVFSCAVLLGFAMSWLWAKTGLRIPRRSDVLARGASVCVVGALVLGYAWPMLTGSLDGQLKGIAIPESYEQAREWRESQIPGVSRVLAVPTSDRYVRYDWMPDDPNQVMADPLGELLTYPVVVELPAGGWVSPEAKQTLEVLRGGISDNCPSYTMQVLAFCNVSYVLVRYDMQAETGGMSDAELELTENNLREMEGVSPAATFGDLHFYRVDDEYFVPRIYAASKMVLVDGGWDELLEQGTLDSLDVGESAIFMSDSLSASDWQVVNDCSLGGGHRPQVSFEMVNPTKYRVTVAGANEPFFLVFSESYHDQWKAFVNKQGGETNWVEAFFQESIPGDRHLLTNGYANAWYIDPAELGAGEDFSITLYYKPQSLFYLGLVISGLTVLGCLGLLMWAWAVGRASKARN